MLRVAFHGRPFLRGQPGRLVEDGVADAEFSEVVQEGAAAQPAPALGRQSQVLRDQAGVFGDAGAVPVGIGALGVDHAAEPGGDGVEIIVVDDHALRGWLQFGDALLQFGRAQRFPERPVPAQAFEGAHDLGIEPATAASGHLRQRPLRSAD